jgi:hypothetical protein
MGGGVGYVDYDAAYRKVTGRHGCIGKRTMEADTPAPAREASPAAPETRDETVVRSRDVGNLLGRLDGFTMMQCPCGVGIKVPPGSNWTSIPCPPLRPRQRDPPGSAGRADRRSVDVPPTGQGLAVLPLLLRRGHPHFPAFEAKTQSCSRCGRTIEIV